MNCSCSQIENTTTAPIGAFDSGFGGLTVLREMVVQMPNEDTIFVGDSAHFPYGPRPLREVRQRVSNICSYLVNQGCKLIVIACNTATAAGLADAQREFGVPIIGVVEPGSRAAVYMTHARSVGVIATEGTVQSGAYVNAIHNLDAGIDVTQLACPRLVDIAEAGITQDEAFNSENEDSIRAAFQPLFDSKIDTLVLGCTHYPLVEDLIQRSIGENVHLVSSARETAREVKSVLEMQGTLRVENPSPTSRFITTSSDVSRFQTFAERVMGSRLLGPAPTFEHVNI